MLFELGRSVSLLTLSMSLLFPSTVPQVFQLDPQQTEINYPFAKYPARTYIGKPVPPKLVTSDQRMFRTVLRDGAKKGSNFAGHYTIVGWGCGSSCVSYAVVDAKSGAVYGLDASNEKFPTANRSYPCGLLYRTDSRLLVIEASREIDSPCEPSFFLWVGSRFVPVNEPSGTAGSSLPEVFASVLSELKVRTRVPVFLPTELPKPFCDARNAVLDKVTPDGYGIGLYYDLGAGNAGFAASFAGQDKPPYSPGELPNVRQVKLSRGIVGFFRPVSCGGSCAPANLWWQKGPLYQVQLKLPATLSDKEQEKIITAVANSAIMAGSR